MASVGVESDAVNIARDARQKAIAGTSRKRLWSFVLAVLLGLPLLGCAGEEGSSGCESSKDCSSDEACVSKRCVAVSEDDAGDDQGAADDDGPDPSRPSFVTPSDDDELTVEDRATTDRLTIVNITNHSYFNLGGEDGDNGILGHRLTLFADAYTPVDRTLIPTGERRAVAGTPFHFRTARTIGSRIRDGSDAQILFGRGYDHNFVVNGKAGTLRPAAIVEDPASGRVMEVLVTAPGVQFYSGNFLDGTSAGKSGRVYRQSDALCLEPQSFPDSPNHPEFPSARLAPGETYVNTMVFRFSTSNP
jgi:aldose 1-epimerase